MSKEINSIEEELNDHLPSDKLSEVTRILYGKTLRYSLNLYHSLVYVSMYFCHFYRPFNIPSSAQQLADSKDFELKGFHFDALPETTRAPQITRVGVIQNKIVSPTNVPVKQQVIFKLYEVLKA